MKLEVLITSPPDRETLVAEVYLDDCQLADVFPQDDVLQVEIYTHPGGEPWRLTFHSLQDALNMAKKRLGEIEGRLPHD